MNPAKEQKSRRGLTCGFYNFMNVLFRHLHYFREHFRFVLGEICEYFSVQLYFFSFQSSNKLAVGNSIAAACGVYFYIPSLPGDALLFLASAECAGPCVEQSLLGGYFFGLSSPAESFGVLKDRAAFLVLDCTSFYSWHWIMILSHSLGIIKDFLGRVVEAASIALVPDIVGRFSGAEMIDRH